MNKGRPISMSVWDRPVMKHRQFHIIGGRREIKRNPIATVLDIMMQRENERCSLSPYEAVKKPVQDLYSSSTT